MKTSTQYMKHSIRINQMTDEQMRLLVAKFHGWTLRKIPKGQTGVIRAPAVILSAPKHSIISAEYRQHWDKPLDRAWSFFSELFLYYYTKTEYLLDAIRSFKYRRYRDHFVACLAVETGAFDPHLQAWTADKLWLLSTASHRQLLRALVTTIIEKRLVRKKRKK